MNIKRRLVVGRPNIGVDHTFRRYADKLWNTAWLTNNGPLVQELEQRVADYLGVKHCVAMSNGTVALELAIRANELEGEVIVPSMTFVATAHALQWQGITPVFADIDDQTLNICPERVEAAITPETTGILGVHLYGRACNVDGLQEIAKTHRLKLMFDAAHAFGCEHAGQKIGNFGECEVFSFHATKIFNTFEGGAVTTNDDGLARKLRLMRNFGFEGEDNVSYLGTNGKMTEVCAAMGLTNLDDLATFIETNKTNYQAYLQALRSVEGIDLVLYDEAQVNNFHYVIIRIDQSKYGRTRDELKTKLEENNVMARRYFHPGCHRLEPYKTLYPQFSGALPITEAFSQEVLALPNGTQLSSAEVGEICRIIREFSR